MQQTLGLSGSITYQVNRCKNGHWEPLGGRVRPMMYRSLGDALQAERSVLMSPEVTATMVIRLESAYYSDLATRQVYRHTIYTGVSL